MNRACVKCQEDIPPSKNAYKVNGQSDPCQCRACYMQEVAGLSDTRRVKLEKSFLVLKTEYRIILDAAKKTRAMINGEAGVLLDRVIERQLKFPNELER